MKLILKVFTSILLLSIIGFSVWILTNLRDKTPDYKADLLIVAGPQQYLKAGFAAVPVTPEVPDRWVDFNGDAQYNPDDGDTYTDGNGNGKFDPVWIAGFGNRRAANGIHDELWARSVIIDDGRTRLAIVALDAIGFMNNDVVDVRKRISAETGISYIIIASTHTHEGPDLLGLWGKSFLRSGVNKEYLEFVKRQIVKSVSQANSALTPAVLEVSEELAGAIPMVKDTRMPEVFDSGLRMIRFADKENGSTLGSLISWGNHPETLWGKNLLITSDFPHYLREYVEKGVYNGDSLIKPGTGGVAVYFTGAIGGLMTTHPSIAIKDPFTGVEYSEPSFEKADAQGKQLALLILNAMEKPDEKVENASISLSVRTVILPIENRMFRLGTMLGILDRGTSGWMKMRSELAVFNIGPVSFATVPGEVYPEIVNGGIEAPSGNDFDLEPVEIPSIREMMKGKYKFIFGLANDEIGYIIPKSQWDAKSPFTYGRNSSPYGEENSLGPETANIIHRNLKEMLSEINGITQ
jgi:hypothetical protein